ncbi:hypothetical protein ACLMJK_002593 [Lecanora helva]
MLIPPTECMTPGKTYIGKLPGRSRPVFARRRRSNFVKSRSSESVTISIKTRRRMGMFSSSRRNGYYVSYGPSSRRTRYICTPERDITYTTAPEGRVAKVTRQTCASCGKFRSAKWEAAHPLLPGMAASSGICAKCQRDKTSSEETKHRCRCKKKRCRHHHKHSTETTDDSYCSFRHRRSPRRYRSDSRDDARPRASSRDNVRIVIANQAGERAKRTPTRSSSSDGVRIIRRTSVVEVPERVRSRSRARSSSRAHYLDDGTAQYVEDIVRPRYRSCSRSLSRSSCIEELTPRRSRSKHRSSTNRVQFVDDSDEPIFVSKSPRRISRRRAIYFDGAASFDPSGSEGKAHQGPDSAHAGPRSSAGGVQLTAESTIPQSDEVEHEEDIVPPLPRRIIHSSSWPTNHSSRRSISPGYEECLAVKQLFKQFNRGTEILSDDYGAKFKSNSSAAFHDTHEVTRRASDPVVRQESHVRFATPDFPEQSFRPTSHHVNADAKYEDEMENPRGRKRRRYRDDSTEDDYITATYRHVRPPSPAVPRDQSEYLSEMLQTSHITPPHQQRRSQYALGASPPLTPRGVSRAENYNSYQSPFRTDDHSPDYKITTEPTTPVDPYGNTVSGWDYEPAYADEDDGPTDLYGNKLSGWDDPWGLPTAAQHYEWTA